MSDDPTPTHTNAPEPQAPPTPTPFAYSDKVTSVTPVVDAQVQLLPAPHAEQIDIFYDPRSYSAFPHVIRLEGDELLLSFRQAPFEGDVQHTHPRSVITVMRSYDLGQHWATGDAGQLAAGGGQELPMLYLGEGRVIGALAKHEVVSWRETERAGIPASGGFYPNELAGGYWVWSDSWGLTWPLQNIQLFHDQSMPSAAPYRLADGTILVPTYGTNESAAYWSALLYRSTS